MKELIGLLRALDSSPMKNASYSTGYEDAVSEVIELFTAYLAGKVIVPIDPTVEMLAEIWVDGNFSHKAMMVRYKAMLSVITKGEQ